MELEQLLADTLDHIQRLGFKGDELSRAINIMVALRPKAFSIPHRVNKGDELMKYQLDISLVDDNRYRVQTVSATHRARVAIAATPTADKLDENMKAVDWEAFFSNRTLKTGSHIFVSSIFKQLRAMVTDGQEARYLQQQLLYKHWPEQAYLQYMDKEIGDLRQDHEKTMVFHLKDHPKFQENMAHYLLSRSFDVLLKDFNRLGLQHLQNVDLPGLLLHQLVDCPPEKFSVRGQSRHVEGLVHYEIPIEVREQSFIIRPYQLSLTHHGNTQPIGGKGQFEPVFPLTVALNLLCGRVAVDLTLRPNAAPDFTWLQLDLNHPGADGRFPEQRNVFSTPLLAAQLSKLPIAEARLQSVFHSLYQGELVQFKAPTGQDVYLTVDLMKKSLQLYGANMLPLPVNFHTDTAEKIMHHIQSSGPQQHKTAVQADRKQKGRRLQS
jgi:hypothetical protein